ncbi:MAG: F0F1 ATP synthase subunit delta, partial [Woeseiaceae bacterium]
AFDLAQEAGELAAWSQALAAAKAVLADGRVGGFLATPALKDAQRLELLSGLIRAADGEKSVLGGRHREGTNFLKLLLEYGRVDVLPEIAAHFETLKARVENTVDVTITSATKLGAEQQKAIAAALKARLGREVRVETRLDENLIGGAVIRAGDVVIDGSLRARLIGLANALTA